MRCTEEKKNKTKKWWYNVSFSSKKMENEVFEKEDFPFPFLSIPNSDFSTVLSINYFSIKAPLSFISFLRCSLSHAFKIQTLKYNFCQFSPNYVQCPVRLHFLIFQQY